METFRCAGRLIFVLLLAIELLESGCRRRAAPTTAPTTVEETELHRQRNRFTTNLVKRGPSPDPLDVLPVPDDARLAIYTSGNLKLLAWTVPALFDGKKRPAVVYLHGDFALRRENWDTTKPFRDAGFVVFAPMLRGENGNPGNYECFYGEVDDVIAAGRYVATLPYVDSSRVFLCGHSVGGTLAILTSMMPSPYRAVSALSGAPDLDDWIQGDNLVCRVFDSSNPIETRLRSPRFNVNSICKPLYLMDGDREWYFIPKTKAIADEASVLGKNCTFETFPGDHATYRPQAISHTIKLFEKDQ